MRPLLVASDKFKGTFLARDAVAAIGRGLLAGGAGAVRLLPISDGGEGATDALVRAGNGRVATVEVSGPHGRPLTAAFGLLEDGRTAIVEVAQASGLWRLDPGERDAWGASSSGTGELIGAALDAGARTVIVAAGGSATTDGGRGALEALGARFTKSGADLRGLRSRLRGTRLSVASDVRNPMCGPAGAARAFSPQKGADPDTVERLEERLEQWAQLARQVTGRDPTSEPMSGAAGGLAGGLWAFAGAQLRPGAALILDALGFDDLARECFAVVTGEGRLDEQTLGGKAVFEIATRCRQAGVPCYAVVGVDALDAFAKRLMNIEVAAARREGEASLQEVERAARMLARRMSET